MKKYALIGPALLFIVWSICSELELIDPFFLPNPLAVVQELIEMLWRGNLMSDLVATVERVGIAFLIATAIGVPVGLMLGMSEKTYRSVEFIIDFFRSMPATALFPLFILIFGITDSSKIAVAAFTSCLIIIFNTAHGVMHMGKSRMLAAKIMGASRLQIFREITFWESLPQTFIGLRNAISLSLIIIVVTEMFIGTDVGLGRKIIDFQLVYNVKGMYAAIILTGIIGYLLNLIFFVIEKKWLHWSGK